MAGRVYSTRFGGSLTSEDNVTRPDYTNRLKRAEGAPSQPQQPPAPPSGGGDEGGS